MGDELWRNVGHEIFLPPNTIFRSYDKTFRDYVESVEPLVSEYTFPHSPNLPVPQREKYYYFTEIYRRFLRGVLKFFFYLHGELSYSITSLNLEDNFIVRDYKLKIYGVKFVEGATIDDQRNDFKLLADVIINEMFDRDYIPEDVLHFVDRLNNYNSNYDNCLLLNHLAVLRSSKRINVIRNLWEKAVFVTHTDYNGVFMRMENYDWKQHFNGSKPGLGPLQESYNASWHLYDSVGKHGMNRDAIRFCRYQIVHLIENIIKWKGRHHPYAQITYVDIDLMLMSLFSKPLLNFMKEASLGSGRGNSVLEKLI